MIFVAFSLVDIQKLVEGEVEVGTLLVEVPMAPEVASQVLVVQLHHRSPEPVGSAWGGVVVPGEVAAAAEVLLQECLAHSRHLYHHNQARNYVACVEDLVGVEVEGLVACPQIAAYSLTHPMEEAEE